MHDTPPLRIGISACLLGHEVRFDGGHKHDRFLADVLGPHVEWVPVCPEVEMGLGTPREPLRLVDDNGLTRMITTKTGVDHTDGMNAWATRRLEALAREDLDGYVLKRNSPSCGIEPRGLYAAALLARFPLLPAEEEGRLADPMPRENFIERLFAYRRLKTLFAGRWRHDSLIRFHTSHKMSLLAHSTTAYQTLGRLVAGGNDLGRAVLREKYEMLFMQTLAAPATRRRHSNVLAHMAGHLKHRADPASRQALAACVEAYRLGSVPLDVPITLIRHHVRLHGVEYLAGQVYLEPHPRELMLRNHV